MPTPDEQFAALVKLGAVYWSTSQLRAAVRALREMLAQRKKCRPAPPKEGTS